MKNNIAIFDIFISLSITILFIFAWQEFKITLTNKENNRQIYFFILNDSSEAIIDKKYLERNYSFYKNEASLSIIAENINKNPYVKNATCIRNIIGDIIIDVFLKVPTARIKLNNNIWLYMEKDGTLFPTSNHNSYRLPIIEFSEKNLLNTKNIINIKYGREFLKFFNYIMQHPFFSRDVFNIKLNNDGRLNLFTQFSLVTFEFGIINEIEEKLTKMEIFYKKIIPFKGWNEYKKVNLEFKNQIICA